MILYHIFTLGARYKIKKGKASIILLPQTLTGLNGLVKLKETNL
jgi:hypothetical protein